ncbi:hypothetical protein D8828_01230 [Streptococcus intermedius]|nr:hypothetical protein D8828_01230 [Streptococcus intermedius]
MVKKYVNEPNLQTAMTEYGEQVYFMLYYK